MADDAAEILAARRRELGLSQRELGRRAGVHYSDVSRVERGDRLTTDRIARLAGALGLDPETLEVVGEVAAPAPADVLGELDALLVRGGYATAVRRSFVELAAALRPATTVGRLVARLFPEEEWSSAARAEAERLIRAEWARSQAWPERVEAAYAAARAPMAASSGVPDGEAEENVFLRRMQRYLEQGAVDAAGGARRRRADH